MFDRMRRRIAAAGSRVRRVERRERRQFRRWVETTSNLTRLSVLLFVPLLIGIVTALSNSVSQVSFLLFPPLASGTYTLFAEPEGRYSSPRAFVGGMTLGALCGWAAVELSARYLYHVPPETMEVHAGAAAIAVVLTGALTWTFRLEAPTAYSTALLVLITNRSASAGATELEYVLGVLLSTLLVAGVFVVWRERFYDRRARYLYRTTQADDHVLVPMRGETATATAMFGARLAAAHDAAKVVLVDVVDDETVARAERSRLERGRTADPDASATDAAPRTEAEAEATGEAARTLESVADRVETAAGVPCEVVVAAGEGEPGGTVLATARETNCDLIVTPYETQRGGLSGFVRDLLRGDLDVVVFRSVTGRTRWRRVLVTVRRASDVAHAMIDYAGRLAGAVGAMSVCTCIDAERDRRRVEEMLADLVEPVETRCETRVSRSPIEQFLERNAAQYDVVFLGASTNRSAASRFLSPPTFERVGDIETDVAIVHIA